jgi:hypothetical protein
LGEIAFKGDAIRVVEAVDFGGEDFCCGEVN